MTELLISVRNAAEAHIALKSGCRWLDVKEPARSSLGAADSVVWAEIASILSNFPEIPGSLALGELSEVGSQTRGLYVPTQYTYLKLGFAGMHGRNGWVNDWLQLRDRIAKESSHPLNWVAVVYADYEAAHAPAPQEIIAAAVETDCAAVLFDTCRKDGNTLWDYFQLDQLQSYQQQIRQHNMLMAIAGGITFNQIEQCKELQPDIVGVRGAVCDSGERINNLCGQLVQEMKEKLSATTADIEATRSNPFI